LGFTGTHKLIGHLGFFAGMSSSTKLGTDANFSARKSILPLEVTKALLQSKHHSWISPLCSDQLKEQACNTWFFVTAATSYMWLGVAVRA